MLKVLLRAKLRSLVTRNFSKTGKKNRIMKIAFALLLVYAISCFYGLFGSMFFQIVKPLHEQGADWLYFVMAGGLAFILMFIGSVFTTQAQLYEAKDNDLLLSMPIPPKYILISRLVALFVLNLFWGSLISLPAEVVYAFNVSLTSVQVISFVVVFLLLTLFSLGMSCVFGWLVTVISSKFRNKSTISTVFSLIFLGAYFYFFNGSNEYINQVIVNGAEIASGVKAGFLPAFWFGEAVANGNIMYLLFVLAIVVISSTIIYMVLERSFISIITTKRGFKKIKYKEKALKVSSPSMALLKKELIHFSSNSMYMMNTALGVVFTVVGAVALIVNKDLINVITKDMPEILPFINPLAIAALCFVSVTSIISSPSISLEGKNLWISQSIPVRGRDILMAKANMQIVVCLPATIFAAVVFSVILDMSILMKCLLFSLPTLSVIFSALFGVIINLHFPKFDWMSETVAVKQSMSPMVAMFGSFGVAALLAIIAGFLINVVGTLAALCIVAGLLLLICVSMYRYLGTKGERIFMGL